MGADGMARTTPSVLEALDTALKAAPPADQDAATVALAKRYALELDDATEPAEVAAIGPKLLAALTELHMTPKARSAVVKGGDGSDRPKSPLDELRERRKSRTASVDPAP